MKTILLASFIPLLVVLNEAVKVGSLRPQQTQRYTASGVTGAAILMFPCAIIGFLAGEIKGRGKK